MQKTAKQTGFGTSFYKDLSRVEKNTRMLGKEVKELRRTLRVWFSEENGFLFNRSAAQSLSNFIQAELRSGSAFHNQRMRVFEDLSDYWKKEKKRKKFLPQMGRATDTLLNNIGWHRTGYSEYSVGVKKGIMAPEKHGGYRTGSIREVSVYGWLLEEGHDGGGSLKTGPQPARPWFGLAFHRWARQNMPDLIHQTFAVNLRRHMLNLVSGGASGGDIDPQDAVTVSDHSSVGAGLMQDRLIHALAGRDVDSTFGFDKKKERPVPMPQEGDSGVRTTAPKGVHTYDETWKVHIVETISKEAEHIKRQWVYHNDDKLWYELDRYIQRLGEKLPSRY